MIYIPTQNGFLVNINNMEELLGQDAVQPGDVVLVEGELYTCGRHYGDMVEFTAEDISDDVHT